MNVEFEMPDKYHLKFLNENIIDNLIEKLNCEVEATIIMLIRALARVATKSIY